MSQAPSMPLFVDAFLADTMHLTAEETGAYICLLMSMWRHNGSVPNDDKDNARITRLGMKKWRAMKPRIMKFLVVENGRLTQKRLQKEWSYVESKSRKQSQNSRARWDAVSNKNKDLADPTAYPKKSSGISPHTHTHKKKNTKKKNDSFEAFWKAYPRKVAKGGALKAYQAALKRCAAEEIQTGVERYAKARRGEDSKFTPHAATWLNEDRWGDEDSLSAKPISRGFRKEFKPDKPVERGTESERAAQVDELLGKTTTSLRA